MIIWNKGRQTGTNISLLKTFIVYDYLELFRNTSTHYLAVKIGI